MIKYLLNSNDRDFKLTVLRIALGLIIFPHGAQKLFGWFGGHGFGPTLEYFGSVGIPAVVAVLVILAESLGAFALIFGLLSRVTAAGIAIVMTGAALIHAPNGFFMNWFGNQKGEGYEYHLLVLAMAIVVVVGGSGAYGIDNLLQKKFSKKGA